MIESLEILQLARRSLSMATMYAVDEPAMILKQPKLQRFTNKYYEQDESKLEIPWPQPSVKFPMADFPTVLHFSNKEKNDFAVNILSRYAKQICTDWVEAARDALMNPIVDEISDKVFGDIFNDTIFSKFLNPQFDADDRQIFSSLLNSSAEDQKQFKVDFSAISELTSLDGIYNYPTKAIFERNSKTNELTCLGIYLNKLLIQPENINAWELAKYYVLQNGSMTLLLLSHPKVHFPVDSINAITKAILPEGHVIKNLLAPHMYLTLPLNRRVQWSEHSLVFNNQDLVYTPFSSTGLSNYSFKSVSCRGIENNSSYPKYTFDPNPPKIHSGFEIFFKVYYDVIFNFVKDVVKEVNVGDEKVKMWAHFISKNLPGFPGGDEIFEADNLAKCLTFYIFDVSVLHASEHFSYSSISVRKVPLRLRLAPPESLNIDPIERRHLVHSIDIFRQLMAYKMFFKPSNITYLKDSKYEFSNKGLNDRATLFKKQLVQADFNMGSNRLVPLDEISASIQY